MRTTIFIRYVVAKYAMDVDDMTFKTYVTNSLRLLPQGKYMKDTWLDLVHPKRYANVDGEKIVADVVARGGLVLK